MANCRVAASACFAIVSGAPFVLLYDTFLFRNSRELFDFQSPKKPTGFKRVVISVARSASCLDVESNP
jgi:hypothetical protein